jgi:4'-phosphopantetheinyl transferase
MRRDGKAFAGSNELTAEFLSRFQPPMAEEIDLLATGVVDVWRVSLDPPGRVVAALDRLLSPDELERAGRFRFARDRQRFVVTRGALRQVLGLCLATPPDALRFAYGLQGKPRLADSVPRGERVAFNVSHSLDMALLAVAGDCEVGIDVEAIRPLEELAAIAERSFSRDEQAALAAAPEGERERTFYRLWTRKEARAKALGEGMAAMLDRIDAPSGLRENAGPDWRFVQIEPGEGYVGALALPAGSRMTVRGWLWEG